MKPITENEKNKSLRLPLNENVGFGTESSPTESNLLSYDCSETLSCTTTNSRSDSITTNIKIFDEDSDSRSEI